MPARVSFYGTHSEIVIRGSGINAVRGTRGAAQLVAAALCICSTPLLAEELILRCDGSRGTVSFSVLIDPVKRMVLNIGLGTKIETENFRKPLLSRSTRNQRPTKISLLIALPVSPS
jgi:hypothetical protein